LPGTGIFGGTFDPVHNGHIITVNAVINLLKLDRAIFIPAKISPFKQEKNITPDKFRLDMLQLAVSHNPKIIVDTFELNRDEVSYTFNTLEHLSQHYNNLHLIIGYDNYLTFDKWYRFNDILSLVTLVVMRRKTDDTGNVSHNIPAKFVETPLVDISSTEIRQKIRDGETIKNLVPDSVNNYILKNGLYTR